MNAASNIGIQLTLKGAEQVKQGLKTISGSAAEMARQFDASRGVILTTAAAVATATGIMVDRVSNAAAEIERFAMLAGSTPQEFQRMAAGAKSAGMDMEKYASVMKDTQDKIGDFLQTGGGELKDFFEKIAPAVGVTADQFKNLSGPQALQLFYSSLEKANLSQKETVFWMESIADDATTLVPLLQNNGAAFDALADRAAKYGGVLSDYALAASKDFKGQTDEMTLALQGAEQILAVGLMPTLTEAARELLATADSAGVADGAATVIRTTLEALVIVASDVAFTFTSVGREIGGMAAQAQAFLSLDFARAGQIRAMMKDDAAGARAELEAFQARLLNAGQAAKDVFNLSTVMKQNKAGTAEYQAALQALNRMKDAGTVSVAQYTVAITAADSASSALGRTEANTANAAAVAQQRIREEFKSTAEKRNEALDKARKAFGGMIPPDIEKQIREKFKEPLSDSAKAAASSAKSVQQAYQTAFESAEKQARDLVSEEKNLNSAEKALADVMAGEHWGKWNEAQRKAIELIYQRNAATIARQKQEEADAKWASESADANTNVAESAYEAANAAEAQRDAQLQANAAIGLTALEVANLEAARIDDTAAEKQRLAAIMEGIDPAIAADYHRQAQALTELAQAKRDGAVKDAMVESAKEAADEWKRTADKIEDALIDALMAGGKSGAEYIEGLFRSMVLRPVLQAIVSPVAGAVTSALGLPGSTGGGGGLMGLANNASSLNSLYNMGTSAVNWLGLGTATATGLGLSAAVGTGTALAATSSGLGLSAGLGAGYGFTAGGGLGLTAASAGAGTIGAGIGTSAAVSGSAAAAGGAMSAMSAAMPWIAGGLAVASILKGMDNSGTMHTGGAGGYSAARGAFRTNDALKTGDWWNNGYDKTANAIQGAQALSKGVVDMLDAAAKTFGAAVGHEMWTGFADDSSSDPAWSRLMIKDGAGNTVVNNDRKFSDGEKGQAEYAAAMAQDVRNVLKASAPDWADAMLEGLGNAPSLDQLGAMVQQISATQDALEALGKVFPQLSGMSDTFASSLLGAFGGAQNMMTEFGSFYQNFYSEAERQIAGVAQLNQAFDALGVAMPDLATDVDGFVLNAEAARETFKQLTLDALAAGDTKLASGLLGLESQLNQLAPATERAATSIESIEQAYRRLTDATFTAEQAAQQRIGLEEKLLQLQGNTAELRRRELQALDASNRGLQRLVWTLEDVQSASALVLDAEKQLADAQAQAQQQQYDTQYEAAKAIADAARTAADEMKSLANTLREFVFGETQTPSELFADTLKKALGGDVEAMRALPQAATAQMDAARQSASTQADYAIARAQTLNAVQAAAAIAGQLGAVSVVDPVRQVAQSAAAQDPTQEALGKLNTAIEVLTMSIATALGGDLVDKLGKIDTNLDGNISESEFKAAFSGRASDNVLSKIFSALDSDGSKMITRLEAIKNNTSGLSNAIGGGTASQVISSPSGMDRSKFESTLKSEAIANNVDLNGLTTQFSSFANGVFSSLDIDSNGLLSSSEVDASKISGAVKTLIDTYTKPNSSGGTPGASSGGASSVYAPSSSDLSAYKSFIVDERPSGASKKYDQFVYDLYVDYARRKPEISGFNYWVNTIKDGVKSYPESDVLAQVKKSFSAATQGITKDKAFQEQYNYLIGSSFSESAAKYFAGISSYAVGGYTGPGGKYEAAGVVHRGEVVFSQDDIARLGGVRAVEAIRTGTAPGYADGGVVGSASWPVVVPAPLVPGRVTMAPRPATPDPVQQEREAQACDQAQQQTQDLIAQLRQVNSNLTELKRSVDKSGQANDQMNNKLYNTADTTLKLLRKFDALGLPVVQAATEAA